MTNEMAIEYYNYSMIIWNLLNIHIFAFNEEFILFFHLYHTEVVENL